jgi:hypothetical protein
MATRRLAKDVSNLPRDKFAVATQAPSHFQSPELAARSSRANLSPADLPGGLRDHERALATVPLPAQLSGQAAAFAKSCSRYSRSSGATVGSRDRQPNRPPP